MPVNIAELDKWIEENFFGHARAIRRQDEPPMPDEPYMSMRDAKSLVRKAFAHFVGLQ